MKRAIPFVAAAALLVGSAPGRVVGAATGSAPPIVQEGPSVGEFVLRYAQSMRLVPGEATPDQAVAALRKAGALETSPIVMSAALTEADVVRVSKGLKLGLTTRAPERRFTRDQVDTFFAVFGPALAKGQPGRPGNAALLAGGLSADAGSDGDDDDDDFGDGADPLTKGKGKKKGLSPNGSD